MEVDNMKRLFILLALLFAVLSAGIYANRGMLRKFEYQLPKHAPDLAKMVTTPTAADPAPLIVVQSYDFTPWIKTLYIQKDFSAVEREVERLLNLARGGDRNSMNILDRLLEALSEDYVKTVSKMKVSEILSTLNEWCDKSAGSHVPFLVRGGFYVHYAWEARGYSFAQNVSKVGWKLFMKRLKLAEEDLEESYRLNKNNPYSSCYMMTVALGQNRPYKDKEKYFQRAMASDPGNLNACFIKLNYLQPRWGGSTEQMLDFAEECRKDALRHPALYLIIPETHSEIESAFWLAAGKDKPAEAKYLSQDNVWKDIEGAYQIYFSTFPNDLRNRFRYVQIATQAKKPDAALDQMKELLKFNLVGIATGNWITAFYESGTYAYSIGKYEDAAALYQRTVELDPTEPSYFAGLGAAYWILWTAHESRVEYLDKSKMAFENSLKLDPNYAYSKNYLTNYVEKGYEKIGKPKGG